MIDYSRQDNVRDEIMTSLWYALRRNGIEIPFPIRTLHVKRTPASAPGMDEGQRELVGTLRQVDFLRELGLRRIVRQQWRGMLATPRQMGWLPTIGSFLRRAWP